ncbi:hypothetical protein DFP72DRAFT_893776 [Ephemerocybe angulata]|uniref:Uncharacterized protein n=1 Tax=Ephemerocybe angulata TaxID=980116 RepID=A0A8H6M8S3_9AGAR|nr:hypothetical protein DFP72DRAFT_893776 [Tulosesus angulatus]
MGNCLAGFGRFCRQYCCCCCCREDDETAEELHQRGADSWRQYNDEENKSSEARPAYLTDAITFYTKALSLAGGAHHLRTTILVDLIFALLENENPSQQDRLALIEQYFTDAQVAKPLDPEPRQAIAIKLGGFYEDLWKTPSNEHHFERCIVNYTQAAHSGPSAEAGVEWFLVVAELHMMRKENSHDEKALQALRAAREACPQTDGWITQRYKIAKGMYATHTRLSNGGQDKAHLESAIAECGSALDIPVPQKDRLQLLADYVRCVSVLLEAHQVTPIGGITQAASHGREALLLLSDTADRDNRKLPVIVALANILSYTRGDIREMGLDEALLLYERAEAVATMDGDLLSKMAEAVWLKGSRTNSLGELQKAIDLYNRAYDETAEDLKANIANNIATIYLEKANNANVPELEMARVFYLKAKKDALDDREKLYFAEQVSKIDNALLDLKEPGAAEAPPRRTLSGQRRQGTRKATLPDELG